MERSVSALMIYADVLCFSRLSFLILSTAEFNSFTFVTGLFLIG